MNLDWFFNRLKEFESQPAIIWRGESHSYLQLLARIQRWQSILLAEGVQPGEVVALCGDFSFGTITLFLALMANRNSIVPQMSSAIAEREKNLEIAGVHAVFEFGEADEWVFSRRDAVGDHPLLQKLRQREEAGLVLFSSGSTGNPKAALHSLPKMLHKFSEKRLRGYRTLTFLMLDHIGGINVLLSALCNGGTVITIAERSAEAICQAVEQYQVELLPTTPTFMNMLLMARAEDRYDISSLKLLTHGSEPMPPATLNAFRERFPHVNLKQAYGLTELGVLSTRSDSNNSQWLKMGGGNVEMKVRDGTLWIRTDSAMQGYLNFPSPFDAEGWFNTGDAVEVKDGYMRILGRTSEIINVGGEKVFPAEIEDVIQQMDNIKAVVVKGKSNPIMGTMVIAQVELFHPEDRDDLEDQVRTHCRTHLAPYKIPAVVQIVSGTLHGQRFKKMRGTHPTTIK
ncbi:MAG: long-chain fatty acid--CoA ligase [Chloroflexota bacterium]